MSMIIKWLNENSIEEYGISARHHLHQTPDFGNLTFESYVFQHDWKEGAKESCRNRYKFLVNGKDVRKNDYFTNAACSPTIWIFLIILYMHIMYVDKIKATVQSHICSLT